MHVLIVSPINGVQTYMDHLPILLLPLDIQIHSIIMDL